MKIKIPVIAIALIIAGCSGSGSDAPITVFTPPPPAPPTVTGPTPAEVLQVDLVGLALDDFYFESYKALITRSPETIVWRALNGVFPITEVKLDDLSERYRRDTFAMYQVVLDALIAYDRTALTADQQLTYDIYQWHLQDTVDQLEFFYYDYVATYSLFGTQRDTEQLFTEVHPLTTRQDAEDYIARMNAVPIKFNQLSIHLNNQRDAGVVEPQLTLQAAIYGTSQIIDGSVDSNPYFTTFRDKLPAIPGLNDAERQGLLDAARNATTNSVTPAYRQLRGTLQVLSSSASPSIGVGQFARGSEYYNYILRHHTTTNLTATQIHQMGLDELSRIHAEMRLIFDQLGYPQNESLQQLFVRVETEGGVIPAIDVLPTYESLIDQAERNLDQAFDIFPTDDVIVAPDDFGGYYISPSFDGSRPGAFYAGTMTDQPWYQMPSLTYHESVPGHHLQISIAMAQNVPIFRKTVRFTALVEGWALYAERLAYELGWYAGDAFGNLGRLQYEALRAARLVMDTGIHAFGWSFEQAATFNEDNVGASRGASENAAGRYSVIPGQATAYMIGMLQILDARQRAMDALGARFDLKEFHRIVIGNGAMPLALLNATVDRYVADKLANP